jgi:hypothetical protein
MAISPGQYNISLQRRADYSITLQFADINLTGWTVAAQVWNQGRSTKYADFTVEIGPEGPSQDLSPIEGRLAALEALDILLLEG